MGEASKILIREVTAEEVRPLRHQILRPHQDLSETIYECDSLQGTWHVGAIQNDTIIGITTIFPEDKTEFGDRGWRVRGMAVSAEFRGFGIGKDLLNACVNHAFESNGNYVWCNARTSARGFYENCGFQPHGQEFVVAGLGGHYIYKKEIHRFLSNI